MRHNGVVEWFSKRKGYGFIRMDTGDDIFIHHRDLDGIVLRSGDRVEFTMAQAGKGFTAQNLQVITKSTWSYKGQPEKVAVWASS